MEEKKSDTTSDYIKGWSSDKEFWRSYAELMFNCGSWEDAYWDVKNLIALLGLKAGDKVLDSCCGVGRHSMELAKSNIDVTGVDLMELYIDAAKESAREMGLKANFQVADVREYRRENYYNYIVNLYTSYGYFETQKEEELYLENVYASLAPSGKFLIDTISKEALARDFIEDEWFEEEDKTICLSYKIIEDFSRLVNRWMIINKDGSRIDKKFSHKIYSGQELKSILMAAGFKNIKLYGGLDGSIYDHKVKRLVIVGEK